ncbi:Transcriptional regulator LytR [Streptomyces sp. RB5]|uniref:Transcriptional regulator LytR n=1 Tax=Streptomyces smaragdinus TaxID=2585196 RepID=A0A7K0CRF7_9ACTN|nr:Transcriptional regulator LytR [Streptomyces smaragdinus]
MDPADQWVYNPNTGSYEMRLQPPAPRGAPRQETSYGHGTHGTARPTVPRQRETAAPPGPRRRGDTGAPPGSRRRRPEGLQPDGPDGPDRDGPRPSRRRGKAPQSGKRKALKITAITLGVVLVAGAGGAYYLWQRLNGNIGSTEVYGEDNSAVTKGPVNILVMGTDKRSGKGNESYGDKNSVGHADTTLLFHVAEDRSNATVLSIPRDMITDIPDCKIKDEETGDWKTVPGTPADYGNSTPRFNESLGQSGRDAGCTWKTVEKITGLQVTHFMLADFNAVKELSTAVGGVEVCLAKPINDEKSHLNLPAGKHTVQGEQALAFVRTRHSVGFGSDLSRIEIQQQFLGSLIREMKSGDTLTNPKKLFKLADAATKSLTVDSGIDDINSLKKLAQDLGKVPQKNITFITLPVLDNPEEPEGGKATVVIDEAKAPPVLKMMQGDVSFTEVKKKEKAAAAKKADPADVSVKVQNGGDVPGAATDTADWLLDKGVGSAEQAGNDPEKPAKTTLTYAPDQQSQANTVAALMGLPKSALKKDAEAPAGEPMLLTLGADFTAPGTPIAAPDKVPDGVQQANANEQKCAK